MVNHGKIMGSGKTRVEQAIILDEYWIMGIYPLVN
jgi:hypothetical protein